MSFTPMTKLPSEEQEIYEEALSEIMECIEKGLITREQIEQVLDAKVQPGILKKLLNSTSVVIDEDRVKLSKDAEILATRVLRRKRLAERLLKDVLNVRDEFIDSAVCQWEHILSKEVTNSICTLLGHPTQSPRDLAIPPGECCKNEKKAITPVICSLDNLDRGQNAKITYLLMKQNPQLHRLLSLGLVPGTEINLVQKYPTFVLEVNGSQLAFDEVIAQSIFVHPL